jgi:flagellar biogenesis protein FliO
MTGEQKGRLVVSVVAVIAFALMAAWFVGKI